MLADCPSYYSFIIVMKKLAMIALETNILTNMWSHRHFFIRAPVLTPHSCCVDCHSYPGSRQTHQASGKCVIWVTYRILSDIWVVLHNIFDRVSFPLICRVDINTICRGYSLGKLSVSRVLVLTLTLTMRVLDIAIAWWSSWINGDTTEPSLGDICIRNPVLVGL